MSNEPAGNPNDVRASGANGVHGGALASGLPGRPLCAGTRPPRDVPCETPVEAEVDGLRLCGPHAEEFWAEARADVLEVAELYLSRWLGVAEEELCNGELVRRLEEVGAQMEAAFGVLERVKGDPRRCSPRPTGLGGQGADPRPEADATSSTPFAEDAAVFRGDRAARTRRGGRR